MEKSGGLSGGVVAVVIFFILVVLWMNITEIEGCFKKTEQTKIIE